jgi:hypothetical protein
MSDRPIADYRDTCRWWSEAAMSLALCPWRLLDAQRQAGIKTLEILLGVRPASAPVPEKNEAAPAPPVPEDPARLEHVAAERARAGKAPPSEVYQVQHRTRIDWSQFPMWACPSDPEMFEGSAHEG